MVRLRIREIAQEQNMNQVDLSRKSGITPQQINRYWNYQMKRVEIDALESIAKALGVKFVDLFVEEAA